MRYSISIARRFIVESDDPDIVRKVEDDCYGALLEELENVEHVGYEGLICEFEGEVPVKKIEYWQDKHITHNPRLQEFTAWDETGADVVGVYNTREIARMALSDYANKLNETIKKPMRSKPAHLKN